jgi:uncharacterized membrane protein YphA (DoxX/SURF4 family)
MITTDQLPATTSNGRLITLWTLSVLVALASIGAGGTKLAGAAAMVELFAKVGLGQWFRYFTGVLEVAAGIGLLISRHAFHAAISLAIVMAGAFIAHATVVGGSPAATIVLFVLSPGSSPISESPKHHQQRTKT